MIVKKIKATQPKKPKAWQIGDLVDYIRFPHDRNPQEKVEYAGGRNFWSATHRGQRGEMVSLANASRHSRMPVQHWVFSWQERELPTRDHVEEVVDVFLERMGLEGHQTVYGLHFDTDNYHLHIAVNRMNEQTRKVVQPHKGFDIEEAHKIIAIIEKRQGWGCQENARYEAMEDGTIVRKKKTKTVSTPKSEALDFENATGEKSAQRIVQERGHSIIAEASTWSELHRKLEDQGLRFEKKGSGAIIWVGETAVKASSVDRQFSIKKLSKRLGDFEPGVYSETRKIFAAEPVCEVNRKEWEEYQAEKQRDLTRHKEIRRRALARIKERHRREMQERCVRLSRFGLVILNRGKHRLKIKHQEELRVFRQNQPKPQNRRLRFETWLKKRGYKRQADLWRYRLHREELSEQPFPMMEQDIACLPIETLRQVYNDHRALLVIDQFKENSKVDAKVAVSMRASGYSRKEILLAILHGAGQASKDGRNWRRYAERVADFAFGMAGDMALKQNTNLNPKMLKSFILDEDHDMEIRHGY